MKLTRRQLAALVSATALAEAQTPQPAAPPADELQAARDKIKANVDALAHLEVTASTEPAFRFHA
jgi:hypothetical protein